MTSNATGAKKRRTIRKISRLKPATILVALHRANFDVYYRRLAPEEFHVLRAFRGGEALGAAIAEVAENSALPAGGLQQKIEAWFAAWAEMGWLCRPPAYEE